MNVTVDVNPMVYLYNKPDEPMAMLLPNLALVENIQQANLIIYASLIRNNPPDFLTDLNRKAAKTKKPFVAVVLHDEEDSFKSFEWIIALRTSLKNSSRRAGEYAMPYVWESLNEPFVPAPSYSLPAISFCGMQNSWRAALLQAFKSSPSWHSHFIIQQSFWGGSPGDESLIKQFWRNLYQSPFALAPRGAGNFSMRFYQALSIGRIPVLINTDMVLPLSEYIDWENLIVMGNTPSDCMEKAIAIFNSGALEERQRACYHTYHKYLAANQFLSWQLPICLQQWQPPRFWGRVF